MKVLAIDDEQLVLLPLQKKLEELGYQVSTTTDASEAIGMYDRLKPDLVIVDINMPDVSGIEFINHIRIEKYSSTPIIVLSGNTSPDIIAEAFKLGINDYIKKPMSLDDICARIKRLNIFFETH
ncbi:response regulator [Algibacter sp. R77976]|uniref:response regulator n=1 Tax=Algibacter sp. R77976 TaxID=3093873 RepID=UPI0037C744AC